MNNKIFQTVLLIAIALAASSDTNARSIGVKHLAQTGNQGPSPGAPKKLWCAIRKVDELERFTLYEPVVAKGGSAVSLDNCRSVVGSRTPHRCKLICEEGQPQW